MYRNVLLKKQNLLYCHQFICLPTHLHRPTNLQKKTVPHTWPHIGKWNSDTQQIGNVKKIWKELFKFDDIDDDILANAASEAESTLSSVKWKS